MPTVYGSLNDTSLIGWIVVTPDHPFLDQSTNIIVTVPIEKLFDSGFFQVDVPQSQSTLDPVTNEKGAEITYHWQIYKGEIVTVYRLPTGEVYEGDVFVEGNRFYTGDPEDPTTVELTVEDEVIKADLIISLHAVCPDQEEDLNFGNLIGINYQTPYGDISLIRLAEYITTEPVYKNKLSAAFNFVGDFDPATNYLRNDLVDYQGNSFVWSPATGVNPPVGDTPTPIVEPEPTTSEYWQLVAAKGDQGADGDGANTQIIEYDPNTWANSTRSVAEGSVVNAINSIPAPEIPNVQGFAPVDSPSFTGSPQRSPVLTTYPPPPNNNREIPTTEYVQRAINSASGLLNLLPCPAFYARRIGRQGLTAGVRQIISWDNRVIHSGNTSQALIAASPNLKDLVIPESGYYLFFCSLFFKFVGSYATNSRRTVMEAALLVNGFDRGKFFYADESSSALTWSYLRQGFRFQQLSQGEIVTIGVTVRWRGDPAFSSASIADGEGTDDDDFILVWKVTNPINI